MSGIFKINQKKLESSFNKISKEIMGKSSTELRARMDKVADIIYKTATTKRPMINAVGSGTAPVAVKGSKKKLAAMGARRISNPEAKFGVPVQTGNLQSAIQKDVIQDGKKILVRVWVDLDKAPYGRKIELGDSHQAARPFIRPALDRNRSLIEKIVKAK
jgi:HK97 gp10 family phage protein